MHQAVVTVCFCSIATMSMIKAFSVTVKYEYIVSESKDYTCADVITCHVPRTLTKLGDRAFQVAGPRLWNSLPPSMRLPNIGPNEFKRLLKTHSFV